MRYICFCAVQTPRATISARRQILGKRNPPHEIQIFITLRNGNHSVPYSSDHPVLSSSERVPRRRFSSRVTNPVADEQSGSWRPIRKLTRDLSRLPDWRQYLTITPSTSVVLACSCVDRRRNTKFSRSARPVWDQSKPHGAQEQSLRESWRAGVPEQLRTV